MVVVWHLPETKIIKANNYTSYYCVTKTDKAPHVVVWVKVKQIWVLYLTYSTWDFSSFLLISREGLKCYVTCSKIQVSLIVQYVAFLHLWFHWLYTCKMVQFLPRVLFFFFFPLWKGEPPTDSKEAHTPFVYPPSILFPKHRYRNSIMYFQ